jgi:hypothetical protein
MFNCWDRAGYREAGFRDVTCGNVAWFPGYPMVVRMFSATGMSYDVAAIVVSELAFFGILAVLWWLLGAKLSWATGLTLAIGAVFPGSVYDHAAFPVALGTLALLVAIVGVKRGSWVLAAAGGFVASSCHLVDVPVVGMLLLSVFFAWRSDPVRRRVAKAAGSATIAAGGVLWAKWVMWEATGNWKAYEQINQSSYGQGDLKNPITELKDAYNYPFKELYYHPTRPVNWLVDHSVGAHQAQLWLNAILIASILAVTAIRLYRDRYLEIEEWAAALLTGAIFVTPFFAGALMSWYRNHAQLFIALILVRKMPVWLQVPILVACAVQYVFLSAMFFGNVLV